MCQLANHGVSVWHASLQIFAKGMARAGSGLSLLSFMLLIYVVVFGAIMEMCENEAHREVQKDGFESIPAAFWFVLATLTTVGYGDVFPLTAWGQFFGVICMFCGAYNTTCDTP